jgi:hypothetical protein
MWSQPFHSANASNAASGNSPAYNLLANATRRSRRVRLRGSNDSMMARAVSNIEEAILMRRAGVPVSRAAKLNCLVLALWIVGCEPTAPGFDTLHPRSTADCTQHIDGSAYPDGSVRGRDRYPEEKKTSYRVVLTFDQALPVQFDLHAPDVWLKGTKYPVRVFGFRNFPNRGLGLCE